MDKQPAKQRKLLKLKLVSRPNLILTLTVGSLAILPQILIPVEEARPSSSPDFVHYTVVPIGKDSKGVQLRKTDNTLHSASHVFKLLTE